MNIVPMEDQTRDIGETIRSKVILLSPILQEPKLREPSLMENCSSNVKL
jgi:hypothetical protein